MIIFNTTFHIDLSIQKDVIAWIKAEFIPNALSVGLLNPMLTKILIPNDEGFVSYALHLQSADFSKIDLWSGCGMAELLSDAHKRWGERMISFSTPMEIIEL